jgi:hypothetical protein
MDQLSIQSYPPSATSQHPEPDEILADLITALEVVMLRRPKAARPLLLEATQARVARIQQSARREVRR